MKLLLGYVYAGLLGGVYAGASVASVYTFDSRPPQSPPASVSDVVSPETARLILARRLGLSQYHTLKGADDETLQQLSKFGGTQQRLLGDDPGYSGLGKLLVIVEGVQNPNHIFKPQVGVSPAFSISEPPVSPANKQLLDDLLLQENHRRGISESCISRLGGDSELQGGLSGHRDLRGNCDLPDYFKSISSEGDRISILKSFEDVVRIGQFAHDSGQIAILHVSSLEVVARNEGANSAMYAQAEEILARAFLHLTEHAHAQESTIILMPISAHNAKRSSSPYGAYEVLGRSLGARQQQPEGPLSEAPAPEASSSSIHESRPSQPQTLKASAIAEGIIRVCHSSYDSCVTATNNCTGRGTCYRKYRSTDGDAAGSDCYACGCVATVRENSDGTKKTTQWGGSACQKKDVSMPFLLIAGFTITMVATVSWGIGLLFSIGEETLPSVIGAGVAGPRAQK